MIKKSSLTLLLTASAAAGFLFLLAPQSRSAATGTSCASEARDIASHAVPPGSAGYRQHFRHAFNAAYSKCRNSSAETTVAAAPPPQSGGACDFTAYHSSWDPTACAGAAPQEALAAVPTPSSGGSCDFSKFHSSWDPTQC